MNKKIIALAFLMVFTGIAFLAIGRHYNSQEATEFQMISQLVQDANQKFRELCCCGAEKDGKISKANFLELCASDGYFAMKMLRMASSYPKSKEEFPRWALAKSQRDDLGIQEVDVEEKWPNGKSRIFTFYIDGIKLYDFEEKSDSITAGGI